MRRAPSTLTDSYGRRIRDLRLSLTDRCNFRCVYCMDPDVRFQPKEELLSADEAVRMVSVCQSFGVQRIRLTGGEPTVRPDLLEIIERIAARSVEDLALTTNGALLDDTLAHSLKRAGLNRVTISLDSLKQDRFARITRSRIDVDQVLQSIDTATAAKLTPVRINAVIVRGFNDDELIPLAALAREKDVDVRFIEYMPLDSARAWDRDKLVPADEMLRTIGDAFALTPATRDRPSSPANVYTFADGAPGRIGVIASVTQPFCGACSRLRITADGKARPCLFSHAEWDLLSPMRNGATDEQLRSILQDAVDAKEAGHRIAREGFRQPDRPMSAIGG